MAELLNQDLHRRLRDAGILPTLQRMAVAEALLRRPVHMTAEQALAAARAELPEVSRATVYAVLGLFVRHGLLRELPVDGGAMVYDSNLAPHHHLYDVDTGAVTDLPAESLQLAAPPALGPDVELCGVDVIVRVRSARRAPPAEGGAQAPA